MLARVLGGWLRDAGGSREAGAFNRQRVLEHFSWRASAQRLLDVYLEVLDRRTMAARASA
jgi:glycosyltransferase involved in cell wall biosynthesis